MEPNEPKIVVNGKEYPLILESEMTLAEAFEAEKIAGQGWDLSAGGYRALVALVYVSLKRAGEDVSLDDVLDLKGDAIDFVFPKAEQVPPTNDGDATAASDESSASGSESSQTDSAPSQESNQEVTGAAR